MRGLELRHGFAMNIAIQGLNRANEKKEFYIATVKRQANDVFVARGKRVSLEGNLIEWCQGFAFKTQKQAEQKCRDLVKMKVRKQRGEIVPLDTLPKPVIDHLEVPSDMQLTPQEMVEMLTNISREVYVTFKDLNGMEEFFDPGVQYIGFETDESDFIKVWDKFGQLRDCLKIRIATSEPTERAIEVQGKKEQNLPKEKVKVEHKPDWDTEFGV